MTPYYRKYWQVTYCDYSNLAECLNFVDSHDRHIFSVVYDPAKMKYLIVWYI